MKKLNKIIGKLNISTLALIVFAYIVIVVLVLIAVNPKHSYVVTANYDHQTEYQEISTRFQITNRYTENSTSYYVRTTVNSRMSETSNTDAQYTLSKVQIEALQSNNKEYFFSEQNNKITSWNYSTPLSSDHEPVALYSNVKYITTSGETKYASFKEEFLEVPTKKELSTYTNANQIKVGKNEFTYQIIANKDGSTYDVSMRITNTGEQSDENGNLYVGPIKQYFHIDMQSWIETKDGELLPYVGVYNLNKDTWTVSSEDLIGSLKPVNIYCKMILYFNGEIYEAHYKCALSDMKQNYSDVESVESENLYNVNANKVVNKKIAICAVCATGLVILSVVVIATVKNKKASKNDENTAVETTEDKKDIDINVNN